MQQPARIEASSARAEGTGALFWLSAAAIVLCAYTVTLWVARSLPFAAAAVGGVMNTIPVIAFGAVARWLIVSRLFGRKAWVQVAGHALIGAGFSLLAYWLLVVLLGLSDGVSATEFDVRPFPSRAMAWQLLENVTVYGIIAVLAHLQARHESVAVILSDSADAGDARTGLSRYFIRTGDDILPVDVAKIVSIAGADDYAEVATMEGTHLVRMTLGEFEKALDGRRFVRVHRSRIVNVERISRAEPAGGGRILLHMENGERIAASRTGSRLLKERVL